jgi:hypothetical protein
MRTIHRGPPTDESWQTYGARFPSAKVAIAKRIFDGLTAHGIQKGIPWTPALRPAHFGFYMTRPGQIKRHFVAGGSIFKEKNMTFAVKFAQAPPARQLEACYPGLQSWWEPEHKHWEWAIPSLGMVPDVGRAVDFSTVPSDLTS